jgi:DNA-binding transcriptional regulator LsrR (DeoR family)
MADSAPAAQSTDVAEAGPGVAGAQLIQVATWFYVHGWSQVRIARELGLDPSTVSRYLKRARSEGIVRVAITPPPVERAEIGRELAGDWGLLRAIVVEADSDALDHVAVAAAEHLEGQLAMNLRLGLSWGRSVAAVVGHLRPGTVGRLTVAQMAGGVDATAPDIQGHDIVRAAVALYPDSQPRYLHAPAVVESEELAQALLRDRSVRMALDAAAKSQVAVVGVGGMEQTATLVAGGHVSAGEHERLLRAGAVGTVNTRYVDAQGRPVGDLDARTIALGWDELDAIPHVVAVAAGEAKAAAVTGALRSGVVDVLVVDVALARALAPH